MHQGPPPLTPALPPPPFFIRRPLLPCRSMLLTPFFLLPFSYFSRLRQYTYGHKTKVQ
ncbi:hypothetical protein KSS87_004610 [Heliosperma pusillum]|nr:hypothetical protein KSS87_004610 [Heliosperma pusillum]